MGDDAVDPGREHAGARLPLAGALEIAMQMGRTVYNSLYLALAVAEGCPLVTADERLFNSLQGTPLAAHVLWVDDPGS